MTKIQEVEVTGAGVLKRAKAVDNILNHTSQHNTEVKASLVAKIIDKEGSTFGHEILKKSKALQETRKLPEDGAPLPNTLSGMIKMKLAGLLNFF